MVLQGASCERDMGKLKVGVGSLVGDGGERRTGGDGEAQRRQREGSGKRGWGSELTIIRVDAQLDFPLYGSLDLLLPHTLDAQVVKAAWGQVGREVITRGQV